MLPWTLRARRHTSLGAAGGPGAFASPVQAPPALFRDTLSPSPLPLPLPGPPGPPAGRQPLFPSLDFAPLLTAVGSDPLKSPHRVTAFWALGSQPTHSPPRPARHLPRPLRAAVPRCTCLTLHRLPGALPRLLEVSEEHTLCRDVPNPSPHLSFLALPPLLDRGSWKVCLVPGEPRGRGTARHPPGAASVFLLLWTLSLQAKSPLLSW